VNFADRNIEIVAQNLASLQDEPIEEQLLDNFVAAAQPILERQPSGLVAGIDSSDNLLLSIPDFPGAAVAGYAFALVISQRDGQIRYVQERLADELSPDMPEDLEIAIVYNNPLPEKQRILHFADFQLRTLINTASVQSPYQFGDQLPDLKIRLVAARQRETTERRAVRHALFRPDIDISLFLKDGRHSSQNVSPRFTDDVGRCATRRGIRYVGVVKAGSELWMRLYRYHRAIYGRFRAPYWLLVPPELIVNAYDTGQPETKTLRLGAQENRSLGGIGGAWVMYGNGPRGFYLLEFNVYDLGEYRPLADSGMPLEIYNRERHGWSETFVAARERDGGYYGTQTRVTEQDIFELIAPTIGEIHSLAELSYVSPGYPIVLADAHNRCKISRERKDRLNARLIAHFQRQGFHPVDFATWNADPHKTFER